MARVLGNVDPGTAALQHRKSLIHTSNVCHQGKSEVMKKTRTLCQGVPYDRETEPRVQSREIHSRTSTWEAATNLGKRHGNVTLIGRELSDGSLDSDSD